MKKYKVLIVDDSALMRQRIKDIIDGDSQLYVVGIARNGLDALEKIKDLNPDIITLDIEMPQMDGITAIKRIKEICSTPIVMLSNLTEAGAEITIRALELGADDFFLKSSLVNKNAKKYIIADFLNKLNAICDGRENYGLNDSDFKGSISPINTNDVTKKEIIFIGCSTGGPKALQAVLSKFDKNIGMPIVVVQHMPVGFTKSLANRLNLKCNIPVKESEDKEILKPNHIYISTAGQQSFVRLNEDGLPSFDLNSHSPIPTYFKPSVNVTLNSIADIYKEKTLAVILTGMGNDGLLACENVKKYKGNIIVESESSCIVYGMPKSVYDANLADSKVHLNLIYDEILKFI